MLQLLIMPLAISHLKISLKYVNILLERNQRSPFGSDTVYHTRGIIEQSLRSCIPERIVKYLFCYNSENTAYNEVIVMLVRDER